MKNKIKLFIFNFSGGLFLLLGIIGIFLPLLPTTPFLILAAICFDKGSPSFHQWLIQHAVFGPPIRDWQRNKAIKTKYKALATSMMLLSLYFVSQKETIPELGKLVFLSFVVLMLIYIWTRKSK